MAGIRQLPSKVVGRSGHGNLPATVEELLVDVVNDGFALYCCGPKSAPNALVACYEWDHYADLLTIRDFDRIVTARMPRRGSVDIFVPEVVVWAYEGPPQPALRALRNLVHPAHPYAPATTYPAPPSLCVPRAEQRPMPIRLPNASRAYARAARLAALMTSNGGNRVVANTAEPAGPQESGWSPVERAAPDARLPAANRSPKPANEM